MSDRNIPPLKRVTMADLRHLEELARASKQPTSQRRDAESVEARRAFVDSLQTECDQLYSLNAQQLAEIATLYAAIGAANQSEALDAIARLKRERMAESTVRDLRESLAALCHSQWSGWMRYLFGKTVSTLNGELIPVDEVERWMRQMRTAYADLNANEKDSDRTEADRFIALILEARGQGYPSHDPRLDGQPDE